MQKRLLLGLCILMLGGLLISAVSALESNTIYCSLDPQPTDWTRQCEFDQFDPNLGTLEEVSIAIQSCGSQDIKLDSEDSNSLTLSVASSGSTSTTIPNGELVELVFPPFQMDCPLLPDSDDWPPDFEGEDSCSITFNDCEEVYLTYVYPSDLADYVGAGQVIFQTDATWDVLISGPGSYVAEVNSQIGQTISITYEYDPPPTLVSVSIEDGTENVPVDTTDEITIIFSEPINPTYLDVLFKTIGTSGYVDYPHVFTVVDNTVTISAPEGLDPWLEYWVYKESEPDTGYYWLTVSNIYDMADNPMGGGVYSHFRMEPLDKTPPSVVSTDPVDGAINVPTDVIISAFMGEGVNQCVGNAEMVDNAGSPVDLLDNCKPDTYFCIDDDQNLIITPAAPLVLGETYTVTLHGIIDTYYNVMPDYPWTFSTTSGDATQDLITTVEHIELSLDVEEGLTEKLADAQTLIEQGKYKPARQTLLAFINQVKAQTGKGNLTSDMASSLIETAQEIIDSLPPK